MRSHHSLVDYFFHTKWFYWCLICQNNKFIEAQLWLGIYYVLAIYFFCIEINLIQQMCSKFVWIKFNLKRRSELIDELDQVKLLCFRQGKSFVTFDDRCNNFIRVFIEKFDVIHNLVLLFIWWYLRVRLWLIKIVEHIKGLLLYHFHFFYKLYTRLIWKTNWFSSEIFKDLHENLGNLLWIAFEIVSFKHTRMVNY